MEDEEDEAHLRANLVVERRVEEHFDADLVRREQQSHQRRFEIRISADELVRTLLQQVGLRVTVAGVVDVLGKAPGPKRAQSEVGGRSG